MTSDVWDAQIEALKSMTPPLRPHASEIAMYEELAASMARRSRNSRLEVLVLGVTTEIVNLDWPADTMLTAADRSEFMFRHFWPGDVPGRRRHIRADWFDMSLPDSTFDLIYGDGVFNFLRYPVGYRDFARILSRLLKPGGRACIRVFNQPDERERPEDVLEDFHRSRRINYYEFRFRLGTSLQKDVAEGINAAVSATNDQYLMDHGITLPELYEKSGYRPPEIPKPPEDKDHSYRLSYPTDQEFVESIRDYFDVVRKVNGSHKLSYRTPVFILSKK